MQLSHTLRSMSVSFDDTNLVSTAGLVPAMSLAQEAGLQELADGWLSVPTDKGANAGLKVASLVAGMTAGADSIDDMGLLRHGGTGAGPHLITGQAPPLCQWHCPRLPIQVLQHQWEDL